LWFGRQTRPRRCWPSHCPREYLVHAMLRRDAEGLSVTWPAPPVRRSHLWVRRAEKSRYARIPPWRGVQRHSLRRRQTLEKTVEGAAEFINRSQTFAALIEKKHRRSGDFIADTFAKADRANSRLSYDGETGNHTGQTELHHSGSLRVEQRSRRAAALEKKPTTDPIAAAATTAVVGGGARQ